jgi:Family of unknown function (DUF6263)
VVRTRSLWAMGLALALAVPALAQDVDLKWKLEKGQAFRQELTTETKQQMNIMGNNIAQNQKQTFIMSFTPEQQDKDKNWIIKQRIEAVKMEIQVGGQPVVYDSTKEGGGSQPLTEFFRALVGTEFKIVLSPEMKVVRVEGRDDFVKKLVAANEQLKPLLAQILTDEALKQMADPAFSALPGKPVKKGDTWERKSTLNMGPIGSYDVSYKYTFEGLDEKDKNIANIKVETTLKYIAPQGNPPTAFPFQIVKADLTSKDGGGQIQFDIAKGRVIGSSLSMKMDGTITISVGGQNSDVKLSQTQTTTLKTSDDKKTSDEKPKS